MLSVVNRATARELLFDDPSLEDDNRIWCREPDISRLPTTIRVPRGRLVSTAFTDGDGVLPTRESGVEDVLLAGDPLTAAIASP